MLIPFTGMKGIGFLGEIKGEWHIYPMLLFVFFSGYLALFNARTINRKIILIISILVYLLTYFLFNFNSITEQLEFKGSTGVSRYLTQSFVLIIYLLFTVLVLNSRFITSSDIIKYISKGVSISFSIVLVFSLIEIPYVVGLDFTKPIINIYSDVFRDLEYYDYLRRMRGVSFEAPSFAMYLPIVYIYSLFYFHENKIKSIFMISAVIIFTALTFSRTALVVLFIVSIVSLYLKQLKFGKTFKLIACMLFGLILFFAYYIDVYSGGVVSTLFSDRIESMSIDTSDDYHLASNLGRWGSQYAAISIGLDSPLFGVGIGQSGFYLPYHYPSWAFDSFQVRNWSNSLYPLWPPVFSLYTRLISEFGFVGLSVFLYFNVSLLLKLRRIIFQEKGEISSNAKFAFLSLFMSLIIFAQFGSFRYVYYWISLALSIIIIREKRLNYEH